jgi:hypothetical protein
VMVKPLARRSARRGSSAVMVIVADLGCSGGREG